jgi:Domain of unknown function (DUF5666)
METMKFFRALIVLVGIVLSACAPSAKSAAPAPLGGGKVQPNVIFTGAIESMNGNQWVINGQTITVDESVLGDGPFAVGDTVQVEASVADDGSVTAQRVETPSAADAVKMSPGAPDDASSTPGPGTTPQPLVFDDEGNEAVGNVDAITNTSITVGGQTYTFAAGAEIKGQIVAGTTVKLHFTTNADGSLSVSEVEIADAAQLNDDDNDDVDDVNDDHGNDATTTDDHSGTSNTSDDGSNHDSNDDHGGSNSGGGSDNSGGNSGSGG